MPQEDKFKKQVDEMARALAKALLNLVDAKTPVSLQTALQEADKTLVENENATTPQQLSLKADLMFEMAQKGHVNQKQLYMKARELYLHLNSTGNTWSMERQNRIAFISGILAE